MNKTAHAGAVCCEKQNHPGVDRGTKKKALYDALLGIKEGFRGGPGG
jgi:hypothetical protein